jgi:hypothetical protein
MTPGVTAGPRATGKETQSRRPRRSKAASLSFPSPLSKIELVPQVSRVPLLDRDSRSEQILSSLCLTLRLVEDSFGEDLIGRSVTVLLRCSHWRARAARMVRTWVLISPHFTARSSRYPGLTATRRTSLARITVPIRFHRV